MIDLRRMLYESSSVFGPWWPLDPFLSNYLAGYVDVNMFGEIYRTDRGQAYLEELDGAA